MATENYEQRQNGPHDTAADDTVLPPSAEDQAARTMTEEELAAIKAHNDFIWAADDALTDIRQRSYEGKLTTSARWAKRSFAPEGMSASEFEKKLLDYIESHVHAEPKPVTGKIASPRPLRVEYEGIELSEVDKLPDLAVNDIAIMRGKKGVYLYSVALLSHSFARALFLTAENNEIATFVDVVRTESSAYPRPVGIDSFMNPPYLWSRSKTLDVFGEVVKSDSFKDIRKTTDSRGVPYFYSDMYLSEVQAASLANWYGVERSMNP